MGNFIKKLKDALPIIDLGQPNNNTLTNDNKIAGTLRILFEDMNKEWKKTNKMDGNIYETLTHNSDYTNPQNSNNTNIQTQTVNRLFSNPNEYKEYLDKDSQENNDGSKVRPRTDGTHDFKFTLRGNKLNRTISNEECQHWLSNEKHYEGELWKFWEKNRKIGKDEKFSWDSLTLR